MALSWRGLPVRRAGRWSGACALLRCRLGTVWAAAGPKHRLPPRGRGYPSPSMFARALSPDRLHVRQAATIATAASTKTARIQCIGDRARRDSAIRPELINHRSNVRSEPVSRGARRCAALGAVIQHLPVTVPALFVRLPSNTPHSSVLSDTRPWSLGPIEEGASTAHAGAAPGTSIRCARQSSRSICSFARG